MNTVGSKLGGYILLLLFQLIFIVVYGIFVRYEDRLLPKSKAAGEDDMPIREHVASYAREFCFFCVFSRRKSSFFSRAECKWKAFSFFIFWNKEMVLFCFFFLNYPLPLLYNNIIIMWNRGNIDTSHSTDIDIFLCKSSMRQSIQKYIMVAEESVLFVSIKCGNARNTDDDGGIYSMINDNDNNNILIYIYIHIYMRTR